MEKYDIIDDKNGSHFFGSDLEYFLDDTNDIGEVYLDGNLIYQSTSIYSEHDLKRKFNESFSITKEEQKDG
tara:strand:+ start:241 stop:453 length:213 start_codon:yes stop_codon:yes gene_type:complete